MAAIGGKYAALMNKGQKKQNSGLGGATGGKTKAAKVISLMDTREANPPPQGSKGTHVEQKKTEQPPAAPKQPEKDLTKREIKQERASTDRHVPRHGIADHTREKKNETVQDALDAANEKPSDAVNEKKREFEEREAERKKREEEEQKKVTYADYQKSLEEKKKELAALQKAQERKVDTKSFAALTEMKKEDGGAFLKMKKEVPAVEKKAAAPAKGAKEEEKPAAKKNKFHKSADIQLGFFSKPSQPRQTGFRGPRKDFTKSEEKPAAEVPVAGEVAPTAEAAAPAAAAEAPAAEQ